MKGNGSIKLKMPSAPSGFGWYRTRIFLYQFALAFIPVLIISIFATYIYVTENYEKAVLSTEASASQLQGNIDEQLLQIQKYYVGAAENTSIKWILDNDINYSDYSKIIEAANVLCGSPVFSDYIEAYTIINMRTNWVISNRGMYNYDISINKSKVDDIFSRRNEVINSWQWIYNETLEGYEATYLPRELIDYQGLSMVVYLPMIGRYQYGMMIAKIDSVVLAKRIADNLADFEGIIINDDGEIIYSSNEELAEYLDANSVFSGKVKLSDGKSYIVNSRRSTVLEWRYYVASDTEYVWGEATSLWQVTCVVVFAMIVIFALVSWSSKQLYHPVQVLKEKVEDITTTGDKGAETAVSQHTARREYNELEDIATQINKLMTNNEHLEEMTSAHKHKLMELFTTTLLNGELKNGKITENLHDLGFQEKKFYVVATVVPKNAQDNDFNEKEIESLKTELASSMPREIEELLYLPAVFYSGMLVLSCAADGEILLNVKIQRLFDTLNLYLKGRYGLELVMGISSRQEKFLNYRDAFKEGRKAIKHRDLESQDKIFFYMEEEQTEKGHYVYDTMLEKQIKDAVENCDVEEASMLVDIFVDGLFQNGAGNDNYVFVYRMIMAVLLIPTDLGLSNVFDGKDSDIFFRASQIYDDEKLKRYLKTSVIEPVILVIDETRNNHAADIMDQIKNVIREQNGDVTLAECAEILNYHPNYLWKVIKTEQNTTFSDYVSQYKFERAKQLLMETDMSIAEIADMLKYTNAQNFIRFFSKMSGMTPGKYRQSIK